MSAIEKLLRAHPGLSPFQLDREDDYRRWREAKLIDRPLELEELLVEVGDPRRLTPAELGALQERIVRSNMAIYVSAERGPDKEIVRQLGRQLGLVALDRNYLAEEDGITALTVSAEGERTHYIPYTDRPISWHTDGYYNPPERQIRGMILHCVQSAAEGGENELLDPELLYIALREENPEHVRALEEPDAMVIPEGTDSEGGYRGQSVGPVFSVDARGGALHMRYTARKRNIAWKPLPATLAAVAAIERFLAESEHVLRGRLEPGMGLVCNNVLHTRSAFRDSPAGSPRLLYRARYLERVAQTGLGE